MAGGGEVQWPVLARNFCRIGRGKTSNGELVGLWFQAEELSVHPACNATGFDSNM